jgi:hypothetical protein
MTLFWEVHELHESTTYQAILDEGRETGLREAILLLGELMLGPADESVRQSLEATHDAKQLKALLRRASSVSHWSELLNDPAASSRKRCSGKDGAEQN